jgi:hypothetical protein
MDRLNRKRDAVHNLLPEMHIRKFNNETNDGKRGITRSFWHGLFSSRLVAGYAPRLTCLTAVVSALLFVHAPMVNGFSLGTPEYRSFLGQPLRLWVPYRLATDEHMEAKCIRLMPPRAGLVTDIPAVVDAIPSLQSQNGIDYIVLGTTRPFNDPVALIIMDISCGPGVAVTREQVIMLDPPANIAAPPSVVGRRASVTAAAPKPLQNAGKGKPVLRIEPTMREEENIHNATRACCFRFSLELADHTAPPATEAERELLRQEMRDRMSGEDTMVRMQALHAQLAAMKKKADASALELAEIQARMDQDTRQSREVREYILYAVYLLVALALVVAFLQWIKMKRRAERGVQAGMPAVTAAAHAQPPLNPQPSFAAAAKVGPDDPISILSPDLFKASPAARNKPKSTSGKR